MTLEPQPPNTKVLHTFHLLQTGSGPDVVLLHPGGLDQTIWSETAATLSDSFRVTRFDARSHGNSATAVTDHRPADDLAAVLDSLAIDSAHLVGSSMGGLIATEAAIRMPERVRSLALLGAEVWPDTHDSDPFIAACRKEMEEAIADLDAERWAEAMVRLSVDGPNRRPQDVDPAVRTRVGGLLFQAVQNHAAATGQQVWEPVRHRLGQIAVPTLTLVGEYDSAPVHSTAAFIAEQVPDSHSITVPGAGHLTMLEKPIFTATVLRSHLAESELRWASST